MNREENRFLLVAGNDSNWADIKHRNICTASTQAADGTWSTVPKDLNQARAASTPVSASRFSKGDTWQRLIAGDKTREFKVTKIEYLVEKDAVDANDQVVGRDRSLFNFATPSTSFPGKTVRDSALEGGTRTLLRVTIVGRVVRNGQTSYARVAREFEVVPKCCKRSFGNNIGAIPWGRDGAPCPVAKDTGSGNGLIGSLDGGSPSGSNNQLDIRDEKNELIKQALCWAGNEPGKATDLDGTPNPSCIDGSQSLGSSAKNKTGVSFVPTTFSLKLPDPKWALGGRLAPQAGALLTVASLNTQFPAASFGTWISDGTNWWMRLFDADWKEFTDRYALALELSRSFQNCGSGTSDISMCRWEPPRSVNPPNLGPNNPYPQVDAVEPDSTIAFFSVNQIPLPSPVPSYSSTTRIYLDKDTMRMMQKIGSADPTPMTNCVVSKDPAAPYAVADCRFSKITSGNNDVFIDTSYAMINFYFDDLTVTGEYMGGGGNTSYKRVHCSRSTWTTACNDLVTWADFQIKCDTGAGADPNCAGRKYSVYDHSELFNAFTLGSGSFVLNGTSSTVGMNVYAPSATIQLKGGGNADPNIMGRVWGNNISLNGNVKLRVPNSNPAFCTSSPSCPGVKVPLFDLVARSFSHASGF